MSKYVQQIVEAGAQMGLNQGDIAQKTGISYEALSRAKKTDRVRLDTLLALAQAVGLKLVLVPDNPIAEKIRQSSLFPE